MLHLIEPCRIDVCRGIEAYQDLFNDSNAIPQHRSEDIIELFSLLKRPYASLSNLLKAVETKLSSMKTGWWIFQTGRSRLKNNITPVVAHYRLIEQKALNPESVLPINDTEEKPCTTTPVTNQLTAGFVQSAARTVPVKPHLIIAREDDIESVARETSSISSRENTAQELNSLPTASTPSGSLFTLRH